MQISHLKRWQIIGILFVIALAVKLAYVKAYGTSYILSPDGRLYSDIAENLLQGHGFVNSHSYVYGADGTGTVVPASVSRDYVVGPVFPLILAAVYGIFGLKSYAAVIIVQAGLNAVSAVLAFCIGATLWDRKKALIPYVLMLFYPGFSLWGQYVLTESTYVLFFLLFLYAMVRYQKAAEKRNLEVGADSELGTSLTSSVEANPDFGTGTDLGASAGLKESKKEKNRPGERRKAWLWAVALGAVIGLSNLVRPFLLLALPLVLLWMAWINGWKMKPVLQDFLTVAVLTVVVMCPWWVRNYIKYDQFIAVTNYGSYELYAGNNPYSITDQAFYKNSLCYDPAVKARVDKLPVPAQEKEYSRLAKDYILQHPFLFMQRTFEKAKNVFWRPVTADEGKALQMIGYSLDRWYLYFGALGALAALFRLRKYAFLLLFTLYYSAAVSAITVVDGGRYRLPIMPAVILLASLALISLYRLGKEKAAPYIRGVIGKNKDNL